MSGAFWRGHKHVAYPGADVVILTKAVHKFAFALVAPLGTEHHINLVAFRLLLLHSGKPLADVLREVVQTRALLRMRRAQRKAGGGTGSKRASSTDQHGTQHLHTEAR